jgi:hypothetical protein
VADDSGIRWRIQRIIPERERATSVCWAIELPVRDLAWSLPSNRRRGRHADAGGGGATEAIGTPNVYNA